MALITISVENQKIQADQRKGQATKSAWRMPWRQEPKKDVAICEKPRGAESRHRSGDVRMGQPTYRNG